MDSSLVIAFRAMVLMACLILVPLAAIFGSAFPDVVRSVLVDRLLPQGGAKSEIQTGGNAPAFGNLEGGQPLSPEASLNGIGPPPPASGLVVQDPTGAPPATVWNQPGRPISMADSTVERPAALPVASMSPPMTPAAPAGVIAASATEVSASDPAGVPLQHPSPQNGLPVMPLAGSTPAAGDAAQGDQFVSMQRRLRQCGAAYYSLEAWGSEGEMYRFVCRMAVANNANITKNFEATDKDALRAMTLVVNQVEAWRSQALH